jgi:hypothetical protein
MGEFPLASPDSAQHAELFDFFVIGMFPASIAKLRRLQPVLVLLPVFGRRVVAVLAVVAL